MSGHEKKPLVPPLRFPEFRDAGEWESKPLKFMGSFFRGLTYSADEVSEEGLLVLRSSNIQDGTLVLDKDLVFVNKTCPDDIQLRSGDIAICMSNGSKALVGKNAEFRGNYDHDLTVGAFCSIFRPSVEFSKLIFQTPKYTKFISVAIGGGNINNLKNSDLGEFEHPVPKLQPEQQKIADCLSSLDDLIAAETQKLDTLKTHKKGLMQQLFPREGETVPRLRFPEFLEAGEWEERLFGDLLDDIIDFRGRTPTKLGMEWGGGNIPALSANNVKNGFIDYNAECYLASEELYLRWMGDVNLEKEDIIFTMEAPLGNALLLPDSRKYILSQRVVAFKTKVDVLNPFLVQTIWGDGFQNAIGKLATGSTAKGINQKSLRTISIRLPNKNEQRRIADSLSSLDDLITAQAQKIEALKTHKKGLMQQLFPVLDEVPA